MNKPAFIVDGQQEQKIIQQLCPGAPVRILNCNGEDVKLDAAAKRIASLIRLMGNRYYPYVIIFDREKRRETAAIISKTLVNLIRADDIDDEIVIGIPDRMIENWLLADWENIQSQGKLRNSNVRKTFECSNGKAIIKKLLPKNGIYQETVQGVSWFLKANVKAIYEKSPSFHLFANALQELSCAWLNPCFEEI